MISSIPTNTLSNQNINNTILNKKNTYSSIEQFENTLVNYGKEQTKVYREKFAQEENNGKSSVEDLKNEIKKEFSTYKLVSSEPAKVVDGQHVLYIDENNLKKMASDPEYKAKVFGLMKREQSSLGSSNITMGGKAVNFNITGSIFSLSDSNESVDGIPYKGSANSFSISTTTTKTSNALGSSDDWFKEMIEKLQKKILEEKREESKKEKTSLNIYV